MFFVLPVLGGLVLSLTDFDPYALANLHNLRFVGLGNYIALLQRPAFWSALGNTLYFVVVGRAADHAAGAGRGAAAEPAPGALARASSARRCSRRW